MSPKDLDLPPRMPRIRHLAWNSSDAAVRAIENADRGNGSSSDEQDDHDQDADEKNIDIFRDCLTELIIQRLTAQSTPPKPKSKPSAPKPSSRPSAPADAASDLEAFIEYISDDLFTSLPLELREISHEALTANPKLAARYDPPLPHQTLAALAAPLTPDLHEQLTACGALPPASTSTSAQHDLLDFLADLLSTYLERSTSPPAPVHAPTATRPSACELCFRTWIPLTVHHLIPRATWSKAVKRGWLASEAEGHARIAFLCRACHSAVHRSASNMELARTGGSIEALRERGDVRVFAEWVGRVRWTKR